MESYNLIKNSKNTVLINGSDSKSSLIMSIKDGAVIAKLDHGLTDIYNSVDYASHQLYFLKSGRIVLFNGATKKLEVEERWLSETESKFSSDPIKNISKGVKLHGDYVYFIGTKHNVKRFDMPSLIRIAETRRSYRSENMPTGSVVDFDVSGKDTIVSIAEYGIITVVEGSRPVKLTGRISEVDRFDCISYIDEKFLVASFNANEGTNNFRLLGPDFRDLPGHMIENIHSPIRQMTIFRRKEIPHVIACNATTYVHLMLVLGLRIVPAVSKKEIDKNTSIHSICVATDNWFLVASGPYSQLKRLSLV